MAQAVTIKVEGAKEIEAALLQLGQRAAGRVCRSALTKAGTVIVRKARTLAPQPGSSDDPYATGATRDAIGKRLRRQRQGSSSQTLIVGVEKPTSRIAHLIEFGRANQPAEPFLRPAADESAGEVFQVMANAMRDGIEREVNKLRVRPK